MWLLDELQIEMEKLFPDIMEKYEQWKFEATKT